MNGIAAKRRPKRLLLASLAAGLILLAGCGDPDADAVIAKAKHYAELPGLKAVSDPKLRDELARIIEEGGTPELMTSAEIPDKTNVAAGLLELFPRLADRKSIRLQTDEIMPTGRFKFGDPAKQAAAAEFVRRFETQRLRARQAMRRSQCDFHLRHDLGHGADLSFVDVVWICARLEAFHAAGCLSKRDLDGTLESADYMLRLAGWLSREAAVIPRLEAAYIRTEAQKVITAVVEHRDVTRPHVITIRNLITHQLTDWPDDSLAWMGDRAQGMYVYEVIRDGRLRDVLTEEEVQQFREEGLSSRLGAVSDADLNRDELYYLQAMRKIIDSCDKPYHQRAETLAAIRDDLQKRRSSPDFPIIAGRLLLRNIEQALIIQARDQANCEAWALAAAEATGVAPPPYKVNPLTGREYVISHEPDSTGVWNTMVVVSNIGTGEDGDSPVVTVPDFAVRD